jgi:hypothetical protein
MVPQGSNFTPDGPRALSAETMDALRAVIADRWRGADGSDARLAEVLARAAQEARAREMQPEELLVMLRHLEEEMIARPGTLRSNDPDARRRFREWLVQSCLRAYFGRESGERG